MFLFTGSQFNFATFSTPVILWTLLWQVQHMHFVACGGASFEMLEGVEKQSMQSSLREDWALGQVFPHMKRG